MSGQEQQLYNVTQEIYQAKNKQNFAVLVQLMMQL